MMDIKTINQKEYLKKYLSSGKDKKKVKKKKLNVGSKTVKIIDDDIDLKSMRAIEDGEFDIYNNTEDGPQIAGIVDERGPVDFSDKRRWKIIADDGYGDITVSSIDRTTKIATETSGEIREAATHSVRTLSDSPNSDHSPPRRAKQKSDSDESGQKKSLAKKRQHAGSNSHSRRSNSQDSDHSPPRRSIKKSSVSKRHRTFSSPLLNNSVLQHSDSSPPRRSRNRSGSNETSHRKSSSKKHQSTGSSHIKKHSDEEDSDFNLPHKSEKDFYTHKSSLRKSTSKKRQRTITKPVNNQSHSEDSDLSPPRKPKEQSDSDLSPPRHLDVKQIETSKKGSRSHNEHKSRLDKKLRSKPSRWEENSPTSSRAMDSCGQTSRSRLSSKNVGMHGDSSHSRNRSSRNNSMRYDEKHQRSRRDDTKIQSRRQESSHERSKEYEERSANKHSRNNGSNSDCDLSPPRKSKNTSRNLEIVPSLPQKKSQNYQQMSEETSGFGQAPVLRDRKTGRRRDLEAEAREKEEKDGKRQELEEKYAQWGRGLKQVEDRQQKLDSDLYEMTKPLARYADDADLERELKAQEREGDPMLAYMKRKQIKEGKREPEKPKYSGPSMPNRFGIRPGYRWDGVDRSNGYEKKWFDAQNARKAVQEEAYKWSTADM